VTTAADPVLARAIPPGYLAKVEKQAFALRSALTQPVGQEGAYLLLQIRVKTLNGVLGAVFRR
jgi:hypothetical protein